MDESHPDRLGDKTAEKSATSAIRELIFGAADGLVSTLGLVTGVAAGTTDTRIVLLAGAAGAISGAISMASGNYLGVKSHIEVLERRLQKEEESIHENPSHERAELVHFYRRRGLSPEEISVVVPAVMRNKEFLMEEMAAHELGISRADVANPVWKGFWIFLSFIIAAAIPVLPYAFFDRGTAMLISIVAALLTLFGVGAAKTVFTGQRPIRSGLEMLVIATLAGLAAYLIGRLVAPPGV